LEVTIDEETGRKVGVKREEGRNGKKPEEVSKRLEPSQAGVMQ
jgi:hypothetical protein